MGDYIEREKIALTDFEIAMCKGSYKELCQMLLNKIKSIPAADVRPVARGEWEWEMYQYTPHCSICGGAGFPGPANGKRYNFCPNCGADMRTGAE